MKQPLLRRCLSTSIGGRAPDMSGEAYRMKKLTRNTQNQRAQEPPRPPQQKWPVRACALQSHLLLKGQSSLRSLAQAVASAYASVESPRVQWYTCISGIRSAYLAQHYLTAYISGAVEHSRNPESIVMQGKVPTHETVSRGKSRKYQPCHVSRKKRRLPNTVNTSISEPEDPP